MAAEEAGWHEEAAKLCGDEDLMAVVGDRSSSIFNLEDINLDDIFLDLNDADMIPAFGADNHPLQGSLFSSAGNLQGSAAAENAPMSVDASAGGGVLSEGLQLCDDIDVTQLEWLSNFCEESYSSDGLGCFIPCNTGGVAFHVPGDDGENKKMGANVNVSAAGPGAAKDERNFRTSSPLSVLEHGGLIVGISPPTSFSTTATTSSSTSSLSSPTSSSCSGIGGVDREPKPSGPPEPGIVPARSRSKRPRPASFSPRPPIVIPLPPSSETSALSSSTITAPLDSEEHDNFELAAQANQLENAESAGPVEKKKKKMPPPLAGADGEESAVTSSPAAPVRKCMHCEITKTPQWRAGPMGPKTLCNACGVRYKSGRLFPEYRPAASPTFMAALHSNSHKKVVEMRNKTDQETPAAAKPGNRRQDVASKACELLEYIRRREWCTDNRITSE
ncbi:hypothetical protein Taro_028311 [Colocasia esculenta]|uniref:GATA-type domain-containing protein n=1 Tax=Colocasia esculenta TaxID=4460 RepID=A0A843VWV8_COLES|nr:hypothetical protein [Colocasia esculenta]